MGYGAIIEQDRECINITFKPSAPDILNIKREQVKTQPVDLSSPKKEAKSAFSPWPIRNHVELNFKIEIQQFLFKFNIGKKA